MLFRLLRSSYVQKKTNVERENQEVSQTTTYFSIEMTWYLFRVRWSSRFFVWFSCVFVHIHLLYMNTMYKTSSSSSHFVPSLSSSCKHSGFVQFYSKPKYCETIALHVNWRWYSFQILKSAQFHSVEYRLYMCTKTSYKKKYELILTMTWVGFKFIRILRRPIPFHKYFLPFIQ